MPVQMMLGPVIQHHEMVNANPRRVDEGAVVLECADTRAQAICVFCARELSDHKQATLGYSCRVYREGSRGGWRKLTAADIQQLERELVEKGG